MEKFLFDVDGVLIRLNQYYSSVFEREGFSGIASNLNAFYNGAAGNACLVGKADPIIAIKPFLEKAGWTRTSEDYFMEQFEYEKKHLDHEFLFIIEKLRESGKECYLATDQDSFRSRFLLEELGFKSLFDGWFISNQIGHQG